MSPGNGLARVFLLWSIFWLGTACGKHNLGADGFLSLSDFYFILHYSWFAVSCRFKAFNKVIQLYICVYLFVRLFSHIVYCRTLSRVLVLYSRSLLIQFSLSVMSNSLRPHGLQDARLPCPSPTLRACSDSCPSSQWCHPTVSSSVISFSSCLQSFQASGSFQISQFFASGGQRLEFQLQHQSFQWIFRTDFL